MSPRGIAGPDTTRLLDRPSDDRTCADQDPPSNCHSGQYDCAAAQDAAGADAGAAEEEGSGREMHVILYDAVMFYDRARVEDAIATDACVGIHDDAVHDHRALAEYG